MLADEFPFELYCGNCQHVFALTWRAHYKGEPLMASNFADLAGKPMVFGQRLSSCKCVRGTVIDYQIRPRT